MRSHEDMKVIGYVDNVSESSTPRLLDPVYMTKDTGELSMEPLTSPTFGLLADLADLTDFQIIRLDPVQAHENGCLYMTEGTIPRVIYSSRKEAADYMIAFVANHRVLGDAHFKAGDKKSALAEYEIAASVSQEIEDYERMLQCDISELRRERLIIWVRDLKQQTADGGFNG